MSRQKFAAGRLFLLLAGMLLPACDQLDRPPLPTLRPLAMLPAQQPVVSLPATFTPPPRVPATLSVSPVAPATPSATRSPVPIEAPTEAPSEAPLPATTPQPVAGPAAANSGPIPFLDQPPVQVDCGESGLLFRSRFPSDVGGPWRQYHAYLPPCYGRDQRAYPVLYLFHGSIQSDTHWADLGLKRQMDVGIGEARLPQFIVIMPFNGEIGNMTSGNDHSIEGITLNSLLPYVDTTFCTWASATGRGIGGISRGGYWSLMIAFRHPDQFASVSGHSSHLRLETDEARYNPLATYAHADLSRLRIWLDWGESDFLRPGQQQLRESLQGAGIPVDAHVNSGGHNDAYWASHLVEYLAWHGNAWPLNPAAYPNCAR